MDSARNAEGSVWSSPMGWGDRDDADPEPVAQELLVAAGLDLAACEARGVKDEHRIELAFGGIGHQSLELGAGLGLAPAGVKVAVLADELQIVLGGDRPIAWRCASGEKPWPYSSVNSRPPASGISLAIGSQRKPLESRTRTQSEIACSVSAMDAHEYEDAKASLDSLIAWWKNTSDHRRNEATTRLHLIDVLWMNTLKWPKEHVTAEQRHGGTYADYSLGKPTVRIIVEAKREGIYFDLPAGIGPGVVPLRTITEGSPAVGEAVEQVLRYCHERGVPIAAVTNGYQVIAFMAFRQDGVPPLSGRALVFDSLSAMRESFQLFWDNLSPVGAELLTLQSTLGDARVQTPPQKLAARIPGYPGYWSRNKISTELQTLGDLILQDLVAAPELEPAFLARCYAASATLSEYALVSKEILEARYSALESMESDISTSSVHDGNELSDQLQVDVTAASLGRRPLILLGDVVVGKSIFIRHFVRIDAKEVMERSVVLHINFGGEPALATDLREYVMDRFVDQLRTDYDIDIEENKFVRTVYEHELKSFANSVYGPLKHTNLAEYSVREMEFLQRKLDKRDQHLQASFRYITRAHKRQVVVFLDNIDQRDFDFQEQVFLIGQSIAETWAATVFLSLRPETFFRSRNVGSLTAYQPRVFTIAPPSVGTVIRKRLGYCRELVADKATRAKIMPTGLDKQAELLARYLGIVDDSFVHMNELTEFVENLAGGNVRAALGFLNTFVGSGHVDVQKILDIVEESGSYYIPLHEFARAIIYGDYRYYHPSSSPIANVFEISTPDKREHFLLPLILGHIERTGEVGQQEGFVQMEAITSFCQNLGFLPSQIEFAIRHAVMRRLLQASPRNRDDQRRRHRITTVGAYTYKKLMGTFVYLDAVVVDTPIVDDAFANRLDDCQEIEARVERAKLFTEYLSESWEPFRGDDHAFDWDEVRQPLERDYERIERTLAKRLF